MTSPLIQRKDKKKMKIYNVAFTPINYYKYHIYMYFITRYTINIWNVVRQSWNRDNGMIMQFPPRNKKGSGGEKVGIKQREKLIALSISTIH